MALSGSLKNEHITTYHTHTKLYTLHFTSQRKMMSVLIRDDKLNENTLLIKGAAERIIENSTHYLNSKGERKVLDKGQKEKLISQVKDLASQGLRILGMSYKSGDELKLLKDLTSQEDHLNPAFQYLRDKKNTEEIESQATFLGTFCIKDPVKPNVKESILKAKQAGITVFMITGDYEETALAISKEIHLVDKDLTLKNSKNILISGNDWNSVKPKLKDIVREAINKQ